MEKYWWFKTQWHSKMDKTMQVAGMDERIRESYNRAMRKLVEHFEKTPDLISEEALLEYFVFRQNVTGWAPATMRICFSGIKFFFKNVLKRDWHLLNIAQAKREKRLPAVLAREEVRKLLKNAGPVHNYAVRSTSKRFDAWLSSNSRTSPCCFRSLFPGKRQHFHPALYVTAAAGS